MVGPKPLPMAGSAPARLAPGASLSWDLTRACNFRCGHCSNADDRAAAGRDLGLADAAHMLGEFVQAGGTSVHLLGGEPLLRKDVLSVIEVAHRLGLVVSMTSNGWFHPPEVTTTWLLTHLRTLTVSIDGSVEAVNDGIRHPGSLARAVETLRLYVAARDALPEPRAEVNVSHVMCEENVAMVDKLIEMVDDIGVDSLALTYLKYYGNAQLEGGPRAPSPRALLDAMHTAARLARTARVRIVLYEVPRRVQDVLRARHGMAISFGGGEYCDTAEDQLRVSSDGRVYPCFAGSKHVDEYLDDREELDVRSRPLLDIVEGRFFDDFTEDAHRRLRATPSEICRGCDYFNNHTCYPGCPYHREAFKPQLCRLLATEGAS